MATTDTTCKIVAIAQGSYHRVVNLEDLKFCSLESHDD